MKETLDSKDLDRVAEHIQALEARLEKADRIIRELKERLEHHKNDCDDCKCPGANSEAIMIDEAQSFLAEAQK